MNLSPVQVEHVLFPDLHGHELYIPSVTLMEDIVILTRKKTYVLYKANILGPQRLVFATN